MHMQQGLGYLFSRDCYPQVLDTSTHRDSRLDASYRKIPALLLQLLALPRRERFLN
jgi:hypothetical protein